MGAPSTYSVPHPPRPLQNDVPSRNTRRKPPGTSLRSGATFRILGGSYLNVMMLDGTSSTTTNSSRDLPHPSGSAISMLWLPPASSSRLDSCTVVRPDTHRPTALAGSAPPATASAQYAARLASSGGACPPSVFILMRMAASGNASAKLVPMMRTAVPPEVGPFAGTTARMTGGAYDVVMTDGADSCAPTVTIQCSRRPVPGTV